MTLRDKVIEILKESDKPVAFYDLVTAAGCGDDELNPLLAELEGEEIIEFSAKPPLGWKLK